MLDKMTETKIIQEPSKAGNELGNALLKKIGLKIPLPKKIIQPEPEVVTKVTKEVPGKKVGTAATLARKKTIIPKAKKGVTALGSKTEVTGPPKQITIDSVESEPETIVLSPNEMQLKQKEML